MGKRKTIAEFECLLEAERKRARGEYETRLATEKQVRDMEGKLANHERLLKASRDMVEDRERKLEDRDTEIDNLKRCLTANREVTKQLATKAAGVEEMVPIAELIERDDEINKLKEMIRKISAETPNTVMGSRIVELEKKLAGVEMARKDIAERYTQLTKIRDESCSASEKLHQLRALLLE